MPAPGVTAAIVLAGIFGAALLWIVIYLGHRYLHRQCREWNKFLDIVHFHLFRKCHCKHEDPGPEKGTEKTEAKRKAQDEERGKEQQRQVAAYRRLEVRGQEEQRGRLPLTENRRADEGASGPIDYRSRRQYPMLAQQEYEAPAAFPMMQIGQPTPMVEPMLGMGQMNQAMPQPMVAPMMAPMGYAMPAMMPIAPVPMAYYPGYEPGPIYEESYQSVVSDMDATTDEVSTAQTQYSAPQESQAPHRINLVYITDELPPMFYERNHQQNGNNSEVTGTTAQTEGDDDDDDDDDIQQIPRTYIPRAAPRAAATYPDLFRNTQSSASSRFPRTGGRYGRGKYAPYAPTNAWGRETSRRDDRRYTAPSNASP